LAGVDSSLLAARRVGVTVGPFLLSGVNSIIKSNRIILPESVPFLFNGNACPLLSIRKVQASHGQFLLYGYDANFVKSSSNTLFAATGHFSLLGNSAVLFYNVIVSATGSVGSINVQALSSSGASASSSISSFPIISLLSQASEPSGSSVSACQIQTVTLLQPYFSALTSSSATGSLAAILLDPIGSSLVATATAVCGIGSLSIFAPSSTGLGTIGAIGQIPSVSIYAANLVGSGQAVSVAGIGSISTQPFYAYCLQDAGSQLIEIRNWLIDKTRVIPALIESTTVCVTSVQKVCVSVYFIGPLYTFSSQNLNAQPVQIKSWCVDKTRVISSAVKLSTVCVSFTNKICVTPYSMLSSRQVCFDKIRRVN
jgi:hypothetical protein